MEHYFSQNGLTACYTDTAITLFWDKPAAAGAVETYTILRNDTVADTTTKTHFTLEHLLPETEYTLFVQWRGGGIGELTVRTTPTKHWLDVAAAPYNAVGDGKTMNTAAFLSGRCILDRCLAAAQQHGIVSRRRGCLAGHCRPGGLSAAHSQPL